MASKKHMNGYKLSHLSIKCQCLSALFDLWKIGFRLILGNENTIEIRKEKILLTSLEKHKKKRFWH